MTVWWGLLSIEAMICIGSGWSAVGWTGTLQYILCQSWAKRWAKTNDFLESVPLRLPHRITQKRDRCWKDFQSQGVLILGVRTGHVMSWLELDCRKGFVFFQNQNNNLHVFIDPMMTRLHVLNVTYMILISLILPVYPDTISLTWWNTHWLKSSSHLSLHFSILRGGRIKKRARLFQGKHSLTFEMQPKLEQFQRLESDYKNTKWLTASHDRFWWFCWLHTSSDIASQCSCMHLPVCDLVLHICFGPKMPTVSVLIWGTPCNPKDRHPRFPTGNHQVLPNILHKASIDLHEEHQHDHWMFSIKKHMHTSLVPQV